MILFNDLAVVVIVILSILVTGSSKMIGLSNYMTLYNNPSYSRILIGSRS